MAILDLMIERCERMLSKEDLYIEDAAVCYPYTYVILRDGAGERSMGVCLTPTGEASTREVWIPPRFPESGAHALHALRLANSLHMFERSLGMATMNAISQYFLKLDSLRSDLIGNVVDLVVRELAPGSKVAVIGYMTPLVRELRDSGLEVIVFERNACSRRDAYTDSLERRLLPGMDAVLITGAAIPNETIDVILESSQNAKIRVLVGSTAQSHPSLLEGLGLTHVASVKIIDIDRVKRLLQLTAWREALFGELVVSYLIELR